MSNHVTEILATTASARQPGTRPLSWRRWSWAFDLHNFWGNAGFTGAIWMIYLANHGYNPLELGLLEMLFHLVKFVMEVPTGIFADLLGRRKSLMISCVLLAADSLLFLFPTPPVIILSFILSGTSFAFRGGAGEAILWHIAEVADPEQPSRRYSSLVSRMFMVALLAELLGTASGGYLGDLLMSLPFLLRGLCALLAIVPLLWLPDRRVEAGERVKPWRHLGRGLRAVWRDPALVGLLLIISLVEGCWQTIYFYYQLFLHGLCFSLPAIGLIVAASSASNFCFTALTPRAMRLLPARWLIPLMVASQGLGLALMSLPNPWLGLAGYLLSFQAAVAILDPAVSTYINQRTPEAQRATVLSFQTGLFSATMVVLFPLFGLGVSSVPYTAVFLWTLLALIGGALGIMALVMIFSRYTTNGKKEK